MKRILTLLLAAVMALTLAACAAKPAPTDPALSGATLPTVDPSAAKPAPTDPAPSGAALPTVDPSGAEITVPEEIHTIITLAPSLSQTVVDLGLGDKIVAYDLQSVGLEGLPADVPTFDMVNPDVESLVALAPDVLLVSSLSLYDQEAPYQPLIDAGVCVICVPTSDSIADVKSDVAFLAAVFQAEDAGKRILDELDAGLKRLSDIAATIPEAERKTVYFEISAAPYLYSTGSGTYLNEMIEWVGGVNVLADQSGWLNVEGESVVKANPDVIFTNVNYLDDPVGEILSRDGWAGITALAEKQVYAVDNMSSTLPNENILVAMEQMARALYPEYYKEA